MHKEALLGSVLTTGTFIISHFDAIIGGAVGVLSLAVMALRLRREWRNRNNPPGDSID